MVTRRLLGHFVLFVTRRLIDFLLLECSGWLQGGC